MANENSTSLDVWMDGDCPLCQRSQAWCELRDTRRRLRFKDFRRSDLHELPMSQQDHESSMWARDTDGRLYEGFAAWRRIMSEIPGWRWLARLASLPPLDLIGPPIYKWIAVKRSVSTPPDANQGRHSSTDTG